MTFTIANSNYNLRDFMKKLGYQPIGVSPEGQLNCIRPLAGDYPRYHAYVKESPQGFVFNLHLDQKKAVYEGVHAHNGEYDGELITEERARILDLAD